MITASQAVRTILIESNVATSDFGTDWCCVLSVMPDGVGVRDNIIAVIDGESGIGGRYVSTSEVISYPHIRIACRSTSYNAGFSKMLIISDLVDMTKNRTINIEGDTVTVHQTSRQTGIMCSGLDTTTRRYLFTLDFEIVLR